MCVSRKRNWCQNRTRIDEEVQPMQEIGASRQPSHQTVKLSRGRHSLPEEGVCVMELASMLAHEPFSDHPRSVCPIIAAFLRTYNDHLDDCWRQDLYAYAARAVGTRSARAVERTRARMCREWANRYKQRRLRSQEPLGAPPPDASNPVGALLPRRRRAHAGHRAALAVSEREPDYELHRATLRFVDNLIGVGERSEPASATPVLPASPSRQPTPAPPAEQSDWLL
jgi:hypothetical protein